MIHIDIRKDSLYLPTQLRNAGSGKTLKRQAQQIVTAGGRPVSAALKRSAPVKTGALKKSIRMRKPRGSKKTANEFAAYMVRATAPHAHLTELVRMRSKGWSDRAYRSSISAAQAKMEQMAAKILAKLRG